MIVSFVFNVKLSTKEKVDSFFKFSPLIDPLKYMMGKYQGKDVIQLPKYDSENILEELKKMHDENNSVTKCRTVGFQTLVGRQKMIFIWIHEP